METVRCTTYILHITPTCFSHLDIDKIRLYTELQKGNYLHKSYGQDHGFRKEVTYICTGIQTYISICSDMLTYLSNTPTNAHI